MESVFVDLSGRDCLWYSAPAALSSQLHSNPEPGRPVFLTIGIVLIAFDWGMVALNLHTNATFLGIAHIVIADPWAIALTAIFYKKFFGVPPWVSVLLGILVRMLYVPLAILFIRT
jgi:hypothetical protein